MQSFSSFIKGDEMQGTAIVAMQDKGMIRRTRVCDPTVSKNTMHEARVTTNLSIRYYYYY
jgi:hypothetical protein